MAGGRPKKPTALLKLHGGIRPERHAGRDREVRPEGSAQMVVELDGEALECWNYNVPRLIAIGLATELDSFELCAMCQWWSEYCKHKGKDDYRSHNMAVSAYKQFRVVSAKFGMTAADRAGLESGAPTQQDEVLALIAGAR